MKLILYYLSLLVFLAVITGFLISQNSVTTQMNMTVMFTICAVLIAYTLAMSLVGEGPKEDERELYHRRIANRVALITGTSVLSIGIMFQFLAHHYVDYWLLGGLMSINLSKIISLIYLNYKK